MSTEESVNVNSVDATIVIEELRNLRSTFSGALEDISTRVDKLAETVYGGSSATQTPARSGTHSWADVCKPPEDRLPPRWGGESDDEEEEAGAGVTELSEPDVALIQAAFSTGMSNAARRHIRTGYPSVSQSLPQTRCPRLDPVFVTSLAKASEVKATDRELAKAQALVLDAVAPLTHLLSKVDGEEYTVDEAKETVRESLKLIGNASLNISRMRRKRVLKSLNPRVQDMADESELFKSSPPLLFGHGFETKLKERSESLKILSSCTARRDSSPPRKKMFFRQGHSSAPRRGSGDSSRGRQWTTSKGKSTATARR